MTSACKGEVTSVVAECGHCQLLLAHPVTQLCGKHALPSLPISPAMEMRIVNNNNDNDNSDDLELSENMLRPQRIR